MKQELEIKKGKTYSYGSKKVFTRKVCRVKDSPICRNSMHIGSNSSTWNTSKRGGDERRNLNQTVGESKSMA